MNHKETNTHSVEEKKDQTCIDPSTCKRYYIAERGTFPVIDKDTISS